MAIPAFLKAVSKVSSEVSKASTLAEGDTESIAKSAISKGVSAKFNPDKRVELNKSFEETKTQKQESYNPDKRIGKAETPLNKSEDTANEMANEKDLVSQGELYTDPEKRETQASYSNGEWLGEPGKSEFIPEDPKARQALEKHGQESIRYDDNFEPDFSKVAEETVEIDNMSEMRLGEGKNFDQADTKLAEKWNNECRNGKNDWTKYDVKEWADDKSNNISRHERLDKKTVDYVDSDIHKECKHYGGCAECKQRDSIGGFDFDE